MSFESLKASVFNGYACISADYSASDAGSGPYRVKLGGGTSGDQKQQWKVYINIDRLESEESGYCLEDTTVYGPAQLVFTLVPANKSSVLHFLGEESTVKTSFIPNRWKGSMYEK